MENDDGIWLKFSKDSIKKYCETDIESWTLAVAPSGRIFLALEGDDSYQSQIVETTQQQILPAQNVFPTAAQVFGTPQKTVFGGIPVAPQPPPLPPSLSFQFGSKPPKLQFGSGEPPPPLVLPEGLFKFGSNQKEKAEEKSEEKDKKPKEEGKSLEPPSDKPSFSIGSSGPSRSARALRRARRRSSRSRSVSPSPMDESQIGEKKQAEEKEPTPEAEPEPLPPSPPPKQALSPAAAECQRAIFAAFLWQEGLVHDSMASASYLKFHPELTKEMRRDLLAKKAKKEQQKQQQQQQQQPKEEKKDGEVKEDGKQGEEKKKDGEGKEDTVTGKGEAVKVEEKKDGEGEESKEKGGEEGKGAGEGKEDEEKQTEEKKDGEGKEDTVTGKGEAVKVEEKKDGESEENKEKGGEEEKGAGEGKEDEEKQAEEKKDGEGKEDTVKGKGEAVKVEEDKGQKGDDVKETPQGKEVPELTLSGESDATPRTLSLPPTLNHLVTFWDEISTKVLENASLPFPPPKVPGLAQKLQKRYEEEKKEIEKRKKEKDKKVAPAAGGGSTVCELCEQTFPDPVTYHMKEAHPGCGKHASGWGYNSRGTFCSGWAGNCGDGGRGGSTWYLMCKDCHTKYLALKDEAKKKTVKAIPLPKMKTKKPGKPRSLPVLSSVQGMIQNARFLLEISCVSPAAETKQPPTTFSRQTSVPEDKSNSLPSEVKKQVSFDPAVVVPKPLSHAAAIQWPSYSRSMSMAVTPKRTHSDSGEDETPSIPRQHTLDETAHQDIPDTGSLMAKPSINLARLMYNRSRKGLEGKETGYARVLAFILRYHDLDGLRASMKQAMRLAGLRAFAMEVSSIFSSEFLLFKFLTKCIHYLLRAQEHKKALVEAAPFQHIAAILCFT